MFGKTNKLIEELENYMDKRIEETIIRVLAENLEKYRELMDDEHKIMKQTQKEIRENLEDAPLQMRSILDELETYKSLPSHIKSLIETIEQKDKEIKKRDAIIERKNRQIQRLKDAV